jgi:tetratricopeptide (TPR) repeat protein
VELAPDDSMAYAIRAFAKDWNANPTLIDDREVQRFLTEAEQDAVRSLQLDNTNTLALAFYAEILVDQQKWSQAQQNIQQALTRGEQLMDVYRVNAYVLESLGEYNLAIENYDKAISLAPNLTFLYLRVGANYRTLGFRSPNADTQRQLWEKSLEYFAQTARLSRGDEPADERRRHNDDPIKPHRNWADAEAGLKSQITGHASLLKIQDARCAQLSDSASRLNERTPG